jgi:2-polyprenyl-3-methyl-5-hydroxy-6-metoxy-1,4-benzoquinol methylase
MCDADDSIDIFTYTYDFINKVRDTHAKHLAHWGWDKDTTATIVRCKKCGCHYVRDVVPMTTHIELEKANIERLFSYPKYKAIDRINWTVRNLVFLAASEKKRDLKFLDFGSGGAFASNAARMLGLREVFAYDPFYPDDPSENFAIRNFPGIRTSNLIEEIPDAGPFDIVFFQGAIEHVENPKGELRTIFENMSSGGYLYVNNPVMDIASEIHALRAATRIVKSDSISHYHQHHLNYMMPNEFKKMLREVGFEITHLTYYPSVPLARGQFVNFLKRNLKVLTRTLQNYFGIPWRQYYFIVRKP